MPHILRCLTTVENQRMISLVNSNNNNETSIVVGERKSDDQYCYFSFMETEDGEESWKITQNEISLASDIATANKKFELRLDQFGPYRLDYSTNGR